MTMRKAVLLDLDDTIFDHQHGRRSALAALMQVYPALAAQGIRKLEAAHERHLQTTYSLRLAGQISHSDARHKLVDLIFSDFGIALSNDQLPEVDSLYRRTYTANRRAVPGAIPIITALKTTMKIAVVTNGFVTEQDEKIRLCGLEGKIDVLAISEKVGVKKPDREIFDHVLSELRISASEAVMIGDSWRHDVLGARNAGIPAVWLNRYQEECPEPGTAVEVTSLEPVDRLLRILIS